MVDAENTEDDLADRLRDLGVKPEDMEQLVYLHLPDLPPLDKPEGGRELVTVAQAYGLVRGDVLVLDSTQRVVEEPENDSDTYRAFYRHTATELKRHGFTVVRTDNSGKDTGRGARGSSSKRDDVDIEYRVTRDRENQTLLIEPQKVRLASIERLLLSYREDADGRLQFTSAGDPFRDSVAQCKAWLDAAGVALSVGERLAKRALDDAGHAAVTRAVLRHRGTAGPGVHRGTAGHPGAHVRCGPAHPQP